jgi:hypothetical protein
MNWFEKLKKKLKPNEGEEYIYEYKYEFTERDIYKRLEKAVEEVDLPDYRDTDKRHKILALDKIILNKIGNLLKKLDEE